MVRAAALASGDGARLQAILDSMYFKEIPNFELVAVISPQRDAYAMKRALNAGVPAYVVDPELFPTMTSHSMAIANKLRDMDIELVILAGTTCPWASSPISSKTALSAPVPASTLPLRMWREMCAGPFWNGASRSPGPLPILQMEMAGSAISSSRKPLMFSPRMTRIPSASGSWRRESGSSLSRAVSLYCAGRLSIHGSRVLIAPEK